MKYLIYYLIAINLFGVVICASDKKKAKKHAWRIAEKVFFITALLGGGPGVWAGMYLFHHKTKHWYFVVFIPAIALLEYGALIWMVYQRMIVF